MLSHDPTHGGRAVFRCKDVRTHEDHTVWESVERSEEKSGNQQSEVNAGQGSDVSCVE